MRFLAPSLLLGLLAAILPTLLHRIGRRRANPLRFAAMQLLIRAERQVSARRRLRDALLLVVRTGAAAALPLLFARPFAEVPSDLPVAADRPQSAVIVLDDSASMQRRRGALGPGTWFDAAKARARTLVDSMAPESDVALVLGAEGAATPIVEPSTDRPKLAAALDAVSASARRGDMAGALTRAAQILESAGRRERRIYLITDLQASGFPSEVAAPAPRAGDGSAPPIGITVLPVGDAPWENRAVIDIKAEPAAEAGAEGVAVTAEIANFAARPATRVAVMLRLDGAEVARAFVDIPAGGRVQKRFLHTFAGGGASHLAEVRIDNDAFSLDDSRLCRVEVSRGLRVLVVNGDPRTVRNDDEVFFLEAALRAGGRFQVQVAMPDEVSARGLEGFAAIFLANVAAPGVELAGALTRYVEAGGGLFVSVGDRVDGDLWNQRLRRLLPQPLGLRRTASARPGTLPGETVDTRPAERLAPIDRRHPLMNSFASGGEGLTSARFFQYMLLEPVAENAGRTIVLRFESGAPALVESELGRGRVLLLTTTVDREWTDLPIRPGFLPLIQEAGRRLAGAPAGDAVSALLVGAQRDIEAGGDDRRIEIQKPDGENRALAPEVLDAVEPHADPGTAASPAPAGGRAAGHARRGVVFRETDRTGAYRVRAFRTNGAWVDRVDETFVVNLDTRESDPAILPAERRPDRTGAAGAAAAGRAPVRALELWHVLGGALIAFLLLESLLTFRLRVQRARPTPT
jgi:hypothetical protein